MKIVIAGASAVGLHLARLLSRERHEITVIDDNAERLESLSDNYDLMTKETSPTLIDNLREVGTGDAGLFIGVTTEETTNIAACVFAHQLGARKTVARVSSYEKVEKRNRETLKEAGVDAVILPEMVAAEEITSSLKYSWVRQRWEVEESDLVMLGVKVRENCTLVGIALKDLCGTESPYIIVAIKRGDETILPHGNDKVRPYDLVYFMTTTKHIAYIQQLVGKEDYPEMERVTMVGGGMTSLFTANLLPDNLSIKIIEKDKTRCNELCGLLDRRNVIIINGDGRDLSLFEEENIAMSTAFIALTPNADTNILGCLAAKRMGIRKTVAMLDNMGFLGMAESLDIGTLINKQSIAASYIYRMMLKGDVTAVKNLIEMGAEVAEFKVKKESRAARKPVRSIGLPEGVNLGGYVRGGASYLVNGNTELKEGDRVIAFCLGNELRELALMFN